GTLKISDGGLIELETLMSFDIAVSQFNTVMNIPRIHGDIEKDGYVTLDNCFYTDKKLNWGTLVKSKLLVHRAHFKVHFAQGEDVLINEFGFSVEGLDEWLNMNAINVDVDYTNRGMTIRGVDPPVEHFQLVGGFRLQTAHDWKGPTLPAITDATLTCRAFFRI